MRIYLALLLALALPPHGAAADRFAGQLDRDNIYRLPDGGLDAIGGVGDWLLTDGELCAVISGAQHPTYLALQGASLVDFWHCADANDQWSVSHSQFNLQKDQIPVTQDIRAQYTADSAWVETLGERQGLQARVRYSLSAQQPGLLDIETVISRTAESGNTLGMYASMVLHVDGSLTPFTVDSVDGEYALGFDQPYIDTTDFSSVLSAVTGADTRILLGSNHLQPTISYALRMGGALHRDVEGNEEAVHSFLIGGKTFTMFGVFSQPFPFFWPRTPGILSFALGQFFDLDVGESLVYRQSISASRQGDAASLLDGRYRGSRVSGILDTSEAGIIAVDERGRQVNFARPDSDGRFALRLPARTAQATLTVRTPWGNTQWPVATEGGDVDVGKLATGSPAQLRLPRGEPMALVFLSAVDGSGEAQRPVFHDELAGSSVNGERQLVGPENYRLSLAGIDSDPAVAQLPPGRYRVLATRGPEYSVTETEVELVAGQEVSLEIEAPRRSVATRNLLGADFHVHSGVSFDSSLHPRQRVRDFVAEGGELLVATEHNISFDLAGTVEDMGLEGAVAAFAGVELTGMARSEAAPTTIGHSNVFPVVADADAFMGGTLQFEGKRLGVVIGDYKAAFPDSLFQLNHPRSAAHDDDISFFNHLSVGQPFDPTLPLTAEPNKRLLERHAGSAYRDIDFDAMELLNGADMALYELVRRDWFALLRQDMYKVATANSDSHISSQLVAYPRSYVVVKDDSVAAATPETVIPAVAAGALYGSTGPILHIDFEGTGPGQSHRGGAGKLAIAVDCAPWVNIDRALVWLNGERWRELPLRCGESTAVAVQVDSDSFLFVEVIGTAGDVYRAVAPGFTPFAFANPVFLDIGGDGWQYGQ